MTALPQYALKYSCGHYRRGDNGEALALIPRGWLPKPILSPCPACQPPIKRLRPIPYEDQPPVSGGLP